MKPACSPAIATTMRAALDDPNLLGDVVPGESWLSWRVLLIAMMGEPLTDAERAIFVKLTGRAREPLERIDEFVGLVGRRGGKSRAMAALIVYLACFVDYSAVIATGERPIVLCLGQNAKQATIVYGYVAGIIASVPLLAGLIKTKLAEVLSLTNRVDVEIRAASFRGLRGITCCAVVAVRSAHHDFDAIRQAFEAWRDHYGERGDPLILVAQGASRDLNPSSAGESRRSGARTRRGGGEQRIPRAFPFRS